MSSHDSIVRPRKHQPVNRPRTHADPPKGGDVTVRIDQAAIVPRAQFLRLPRTQPNRRIYVVRGDAITRIA